MKTLLVWLCFSSSVFASSVELFHIKEEFYVNEAPEYEYKAVAYTGDVLSIIYPEQFSSLTVVDNESSDQVMMFSMALLRNQPLQLFVNDGSSGRFYYYPFLPPGSMVERYELEIPYWFEDVDPSGIGGMEDYGAVLHVYGIMGSVPEPSTLFLCCLCVPFLFRRSR